MSRVLIIAVTLAASAPAHGFHEIDSFDRSANSGGGAGNYYTGSPRFKGYDCSLCHRGAANQISIELSGNLVSGTYSPSRVYTIELGLLGEHRGLNSAFNPNTFTAEIVDRNGVAIGAIGTPAGSIVERLDDGHVAVARGLGNGETRWVFTWESPAEAVPATLYVAMLDGDGANDPDRRFIDPLNDDVAAIKFELCPEGAQCDGPPPESSEETSPAGCAVGAGSDRRTFWLALLLLAFVGGRRRLRA